MAVIQDIPKTYAEAVQTLANWQAEAGADDLRIFVAGDLGDNVVRLIDVSDDLPDIGDIPVYRMGSSSEFPFRSAVALARPEQWKIIQSGADGLALPADFKITDARQVWPPIAERATA
jgi:hypothetical protein